MTRGNQRDINRARAEARREQGPQNGHSRIGKVALTDAQIMREKQRQAELKKQQQEQKQGQDPKKSNQVKK